ncbi:MAG TPA: sigma 54-interacting transcriptional regulator [Syntrophomonas sp.]|nr:sigma 54-interacting transcriptional regulator [Syntrophomonas sp.]
MKSILEELGDISLEDMIYHSPDGVLITDAEGKIRFINKVILDDLDITSKEALGKNIEAFQSVYFSYSTTVNCIKQEKQVTDMLASKFGETVITTSTPMYDSKGRFVAVLALTRKDFIISRYLEELEKEKQRLKSFKGAAKYLGAYGRNNGDVIAVSKRMIKILELCETVAKTDSSVMISGESGTGKEVLAKHIHENSNRSKEIFLPVNCSAIPAELIESEFFGYVKGAFTGANPAGNIGLFEMANKGTLFLDEIGDMPLGLQAKLLRVLENGEIRPVGSLNFKKVDVRIIAATNKDLKKMVKEKVFRADLYYRLNVVLIHLPPLRERKDDIMELANYFLKRYNQKYGMKKILSSNSEKMLLDYSWPGNVRELRNIIERGVITSSLDIISIPNLSYSEADHAYPQGEAGEDEADFIEMDLNEKLERTEYHYLSLAYDHYGNMREAADALKMKKSTFGARMKYLKDKYGEDENL